MIMTAIAANLYEILSDDELIHDFEFANRLHEAGLTSSISEYEYALLPVSNEAFDISY